MNPKTPSPVAVAVAAAVGLAAGAPACATTTLPFDGTVYLSGGTVGSRCAPDLTLDNFNMTQTHSNYGPFVMNLSECIHPPPPTTTYDGHFSFGFANGTMVGTSYSIISSTATAGVFNLDGQYTVTGGTGDFAGASGVLISRGQLDRRLFPTDSAAMLTWVGSVNVVPEPATYGLMLAGLGVLAFALRRA